MGEKVLGDIHEKANGPASTDPGINEQPVLTPHLDEHRHHHRHHHRKEHRGGEQKGGRSKRGRRVRKVAGRIATILFAVAVLVVLAYVLAANRGEQLVP